MRIAPGRRGGTKGARCSSSPEIAVRDPDGGVGKEPAYQVGKKIQRGLKKEGIEKEENRGEILGAERISSV